MSLRFCASLAVVFTASVAFAHEGPRIFLGNADGRVVTYLGNNNELSTSFTASRLFTTPLPNLLNSGVYTNSFPGFQVAEGFGVATGTSFSFNIAGPLYYFANYNSVNNTGAFFPVSAAFAGSTVPQMAVSKSTSLSITSDGPVSGYSFLTYNAPGDHGHNTFTLFGNGMSASDGAAGVYALPLNITGSGLATSETFYLLLGKEVALDSTQFMAAITAANATLLPEPGMLAFAVPALLLLRRRQF